MTSECYDVNEKPITQELLSLESDRVFIAMETEKVVCKVPERGNITRRSIVVGQLVFDRSQALEKSAKLKIAFPRQFQPWHTQVALHSGGPSPVHVNNKDGSKFYIAIDQLVSPIKPTYWDKDGEEVNVEDIQQHLKEPPYDEAQNRHNPTNFKMYGVGGIKTYALHVVDKDVTFEDGVEVVKRLAVKLHNLNR